MSTAVWTVQGNFIFIKIGVWTDLPFNYRAFLNFQICRHESTILYFYLVSLCFLLRPILSWCCNSAYWRRNWGLLLLIILLFIQIWLHIIHMIDILCLVSLMRFMLKLLWNVCTVYCRSCWYCSRSFVAFFWFGSYHF